MGNHSAVATMLAFVRSSVWWVIFFVTTIVYAVLGQFLVVLPMEWRYRLISTWGSLNILTLKWICGVRYRIEGKENLPDGPAIVLSNHQSTWETLAFTRIFPPQVWVLKKSLLRVPFFGWGIAILKPIAIDRSAGATAMEQVVEQGRKRLEDGFWVVVFPEGTRVAPGKKKRYKMGGAVLAAETGYPVVPVAHNAGYFWPRHQFIKWPGEIIVRIGPVIETAGVSAEEINQKAEAWIRAHMPDSS